MFYKSYASVEIRHQNRLMSNASEFLKIKLKTWDVLDENENAKIIPRD